DPYHYIKRQLLWALISIVVMFVVQRIDYRLWRPLALPGIVVAIGLLVLVLAIGREAGGAKAWIQFGAFGFQPSETAKLAVINFTAAFIAFRRDGVRRFWTGLLPPLFVLGL